MEITDNQKAGLIPFFFVIFDFVSSRNLSPADLYIQITLHLYFRLILFRKLSASLGHRKLQRPGYLHPT